MGSHLGDQGIEWESHVAAKYLYEDPDQITNTCKNHYMVPHYYLNIPISIHLGCVWIKDLVKKNKIKMKKVDNLMVVNGKNFHFYFRFPHQIIDPNTALEHLPPVAYY